MIGRDPSTPCLGERRDRSELRQTENRQKLAKRHRAWKAFGLILLLLVIVFGVGRVFLPAMVRDYVNRTLDRNLLYEGRIGEVQVHLWRGAYSITDIHISQRSGNVPVPLLSAKRVDFSIQWDPLIHGRVVGEFVMHEPELNFVAASDQNESQTGSGGPWLEMIRDLFPFTINSAVIQNGSVHFRGFQSQKPVDVYLSHVEATIDDLGNIRDQTNPMVTKVQAKALAMDQATLQCKMTLDPFSYRPTFHLLVWHRTSKRTTCSSSFEGVGPIIFASRYHRSLFSGPGPAAPGGLAAAPACAPDAASTASPPGSLALTPGVLKESSHNFVTAPLDGRPARGRRWPPGRARSESDTLGRFTTSATL
jgi:hypothetical protein